MNSLKEKIVEKLEHLPETALAEVLDFVDFLKWRKMVSPESLLSEKTVNLQREEIDNDCLVHYVGGVLVVKAQGATNLETAIDDLREERIRELICW